MNFAEEIIEWYQLHKRDLPWRNTNDPYIIWLSEIIMQQTRVEQGMPYFNRFAEKYPTVKQFANAKEEEILKLWQGLGYYSRGRNMHHTAKIVMEEHAGYFPSSYDSLIKLKGIGEYTAAAISSFSSNEAKAVVDGNVFRLLSRYFGIDTPINSGKGKKLFTELANELLDKSQAGEFNQAIMEFGSLQCKPKNPDCLACPLQVGCEAKKSNRIQELPIKIKSETPDLTPIALNLDPAIADCFRSFGTAKNIIRRRCKNWTISACIFDSICCIQNPLLKVILCKTLLYRNYTILLLGIIYPV